MRGLHRLLRLAGPPHSADDDPQRDDFDDFATRDDEADLVEVKEAFLFLAVLSVLVCCCFSSCVVRRLRHLAGGRSPSAELTRPLLDDTDAEAILGDGGATWTCPVCRLVNGREAQSCDVCGLDKTAATGKHAKRWAELAREAAGYAPEEDEEEIYDADEAAVAEPPKKASLLSGFFTAPTKDDGAESDDAEAPVASLTPRQRRACRRHRWRRVLEDHGAVWRRDERAAPAPGAPASVHELFSEAPGATDLTEADGAGADLIKAGRLGRAYAASAAKQLKSRELARPRRRRRRRRPRNRMGHGTDSEDDEPNEQQQLPPPDTAPPVPPPTADEARERARELDRAAALPFREKYLWLERELDAVRFAPSDGYVRLEVRRSCLLEDSVQQLLALDSKALRQWMRVQFADEPGIDVGGLEREWFSLAIEAVLDPQVGVFRPSPGDGGLRFDPAASLPPRLGGHPRARELYEFVGRLVGKAVLERITLDAPLSLPVYAQLLGRVLEFDDLDCLDPELCRNLRWVARADDVDALGLDFSVAVPRTCPFGGADTTAEAGERNALGYRVAEGNVVVRDLVENGASIDVTNENKRDYCRRLWKHHVVEAGADALWHLARGVYAVLPPDALSVFDARRAPRGNLPRGNRERRPRIGSWDESRRRHQIGSSAAPPRPRARYSVGSTARRAGTSSSCCSAARGASTSTTGSRTRSTAASTGAAARSTPSSSGGGARSGR